MNRRSFLGMFGRLFAGVAAVAIAPIRLFSPLPKPRGLGKSEIQRMVEVTLRDLGNAKWTDIHVCALKHEGILKLLKFKKIVFGKGKPYEKTLLAYSAENLEQLSAIPQRSPAPLPLDETSRDS